MALNLNFLTTYVDERKLPLIGEAVLKSKTATLCNVQTGVKYKSAINLVKTDVMLQDGSACGFADNGSVELSQRVITAPAIKINQEFCHKDFLKYWTNYETRIAAGDEKMPFEEFFIGKIVDSAKAKVEKLLWQGDTEGEVDNLTDGFLKVLGEDAIKATTNASAFTAIKNVYLAIPEEILDKAVIFVGADTYRSFVMELVEKNLYHYSADNTNEEIYYPGTTTKIVAVNGLNSTKKIVAADAENLYIGCDMLDDMEKFDFWYSKDNDCYRLNISFNLGAQVAFPNQVVVGGLA